MVSELGSSIEFQMSLLLFVALGGYLLASRINQSAVIGEILVGILIGPSLFGLITYTDFVGSIAHLGAIILLFVVGLEFKFRDLAKPTYGLIALLGVIVPWIGGYLTAVLFGYEFQAALFVGTALTATSIAITANVLREMGKLQSDAAKAIIGAAVIDDVLALLVLSGAEQVVSGALSFGTIGMIVLKAIVFLSVGTWIGLKVLSPLISRVDHTKLAHQYPEFAFIFAMMIAFAYAMGAELMGLSAIVGSFLAGVVLEGVNLTHSKDYREGAEYLHIIFASIFFVSLGILVDLRALDFGFMIFLLVLTVVAILTKLIGCGLPAKWLGLKWRDAAIVGFGMSPRGEVAMIIALIGLNQNLIGQDIYVTLVLMSLLTTIVTPIVLRNWLMRPSAQT